MPQTFKILADYPQTFNLLQTSPQTFRNVIAKAPLDEKIQEKFIFLILIIFS